jgi:hypothetical protein
MTSYVVVAQDSTQPYVLFSPSNGTEYKKAGLQT